MLHAWVVGKLIQMGLFAFEIVMMRSVGGVFQSGQCLTEGKMVEEYFPTDIWI